ncbi:MAG TPA: squalene/phytoene synthase family protein [Candidatus Saccharimonadales bacterium]
MKTDTRTYEQRLLKQGNYACFGSAAFFPKRYRDDFLRLYYYVHAVDYLANRPIPARDEYLALRTAWDDAKHDPQFATQAEATDTVQQRTIKYLVYLTRECRVDPTWLDAYFDTRQADFDSDKTYETLNDTLEYIAGTAEMIALATCRIMQAEPIVCPAMRMGSRAIQYLNLLRDTAEYNALGRCYIPKEDLVAFGLKDLRRETALAHGEAFKECIRQQISRCGLWQRLAKEDICYLPKDCKVSLTTALEMYEWVAATIEAHPFVIFDYKVKPAKHRVLLAGLAHMLRTNS